MLGVVLPDSDACYRAVRSRDQRFDGWFVTAVSTTGIYCRPSCPAITPKRQNVRFYPTAASAQAAGFRACKRCRPDATPGSPEWDRRGDAVARAMRLIGDGVVDREGVEGLARRLGYSSRQVHRLLVAELGVGPLAIARARRAQTARVLIETTELPFTSVAFAAGFASVRQFNDTVREVFAATPAELRRAGAGATGVEAGWISLRLPYRRPFTAEPVFAHLVATAVPGVEQWAEGTYRRTLRLPHGPGVVGLRPDDGQVTCTLRLAELRDLSTAVARCRALLDLDADPSAVDAVLATDPALAPLVALRPGLRIPRGVDGGELALRAILGQQVSTAAARTLTGLLVQAAGTPLEGDQRGLTHLFPEPAAVADAARTLPLPDRRRATLTRVAEALADGTLVLDPGADREAALARLAAIPGIGPWTTATIAMRALGDPDAFLAGDLGVRRSAHALGLPARPAELERRAASWRPWRSYAVQHLWAALDHPVSRLPEDPPCPSARTPARSAS